MLEISNIDKTTDVPASFGTIMSGRSRGTLEHKISAIRISNEMTNLLSLDLLRGGHIILFANYLYMNFLSCFFVDLLKN